MDKLTLDELRRELAEAQGWKFKRSRVKSILTVTVYKDNTSWSMDFRLAENDHWPTPVLRYRENTLLDDAVDNGIIPDWPRDTDAALALCLAVSRNHLDYMVTHVWETRDNAFGAGFYRMGATAKADITTHTRIYIAFGATPAEALARLAWEYYRGAASND